MFLCNNLSASEEANSSLVAIVGPTGSGKSSLALRIAKSLEGEIVNFDSVQVYRGLNIGSAKTPYEERSGVPHHLIDVISPAEELTAGAYANLARTCLAELTSRRALPVLVGGTGFYLRSLLEGLSPAPERNSELRQRLSEAALRRPRAPHRLLRRMDSAAAGRIHPNDAQKVIRAVELGAGTQPCSPGTNGLAARQPLTGFQILKIGLNPVRAGLYEQINLRSIRMFARGLLAETESLLNSGIQPQAKALQTLGYKQAVAVLEGRLSEAEAIEEVQIKTRQYAKRQMTWFRRESGVHWLNGFGAEPQIQEAALTLVSAFARLQRITV